MTSLLEVYAPLVPSPIVETMAERTGAAPAPRGGAIVITGVGTRHSAGEPETADPPANGRRPGAGVRFALAALSGLALVVFALYAAFLASRVEDVTAAQPIVVPGG